MATLSEERFIDVNPSFLAMSGYSLEEVIGHTAGELRLGKDRETIANIIQRLVDTGAVYNQEF
ncbi:PAS domain-containing protein [Symplocastrum sp. BBK-W-15]|uniref:PAS domain-containing protein n=1 Tax=Limnofasciculus baicalensis BBK-W-15 TaxID=2699891 RepID=A0AAE3KK91_9CYAN|nr:PAS domain-containing protein [Limnofasciculus baicalensis BBK-W-15]